ncbi:hypothetical protein GJ688_05440 [Heliobacillus mobilis]|uniref:DUF1360 domain-containing protein n=1 Tax=Heliobacterium mobile TaxID=28064 RepID=A0A6I3SHY0_HELMO|nr:hypothetical protein [Heliobacterium mobile]MTV48426.1 hypothetical protein [Heliobacterium mobile]
MLVDLLFALAIRFFVFDFILFKPVRERLKSLHYLLKKLLSCPFCQGFWCGLFVYLWNHYPFYSFAEFIQFGFIVAFCAFTWSVVMHPLIEYFEKDRDIHLT